MYIGNPHVSYSVLFLCVQSWVLLNCEASDSVRGRDSKTTNKRFVDARKRTRHLRNFDERIIGGKPVKYPFFGMSAGPMLCGSTLIHDDILLSAAHCAGAFSAGAFVGASRIDGRGGVYVSVEKEIKHPDFDKLNFRNDIMIIRLRDAVPLPFAKLNFKSQTPREGQYAAVLGFGNIYGRNDFSDKLMGVSVPVQSPRKCSRHFKGGIDDEIMICAGGEKDKDACSGDSGGPLLSEVGEQVGIVSFGDGCGREGVPAVYTRVSAFRKFIEDSICKQSRFPPSRCKPRENNVESIGGWAELISGFQEITAVATAAGLQRPATKNPTASPTSAPSRGSVPTENPSLAPSGQPFSAPISQMSGAPTIHPSSEPTNHPTEQSSEIPTKLPYGSPTSQPTGQPTNDPTKQPNIPPTRQPTGQPSDIPTKQPYAKPTNPPRDQPHAVPTKKPRGITNGPTGQPIVTPIIQQNNILMAPPTGKPSAVSTKQSHDATTSQPTSQMTDAPSKQPFNVSTGQLADNTTGALAKQTSVVPTNHPRNTPTLQPFRSPSKRPAMQPTQLPTQQPLGMPTTQPTQSSTTNPSNVLTRSPSRPSPHSTTLQPSAAQKKKSAAHRTRAPINQPSLALENTSIATPHHLFAATTPINIASTVPATGDTSTNVPSPAPQGTPRLTLPTSSPTTDYHSSSHRSNSSSTKAHHSPTLTKVPPPSSQASISVVSLWHLQPKNKSMKMKGAKHKMQKRRGRKRARAVVISRAKKSMQPGE